jgi:hypothetical protein
MYASSRRASSLRRAVTACACRASRAAAAGSRSPAARAPSSPRTRRAAVGRMAPRCRARRRRANAKRLSPRTASRSRRPCPSTVAGDPAGAAEDTRDVRLGDSERRPARPSPPDTRGRRDHQRRRRRHDAPSRRRSRADRRRRSTARPWPRGRPAGRSTSNVKATRFTSPGIMFEMSKRPSWRSSPSPERFAHVRLRLERAPAPRVLHRQVHRERLAALEAAVAVALAVVGDLVAVREHRALERLHRDASLASAGACPRASSK